MAKIVQENVNSSVATKRRSARKALLQEHMKQLNLVSPADAETLGAEASVASSETINNMIESLKPEETTSKTDVPRKAPVVKKTAVQLAREARMAERKKRAKSTAAKVETKPMTRQEKLDDFEEKIRGDLDLNSPIETAIVSRNGKQNTVIVSQPLISSTPDADKARLMSVFGISLSVGMFIGAGIAFFVMLHGA